MTRMVNVHEAKTHLSRLLDRVSQGEEIVIARAGKPAARLVPIRERPERREPGSASGRVGGGGPQKGVFWGGGVPEKRQSVWTQTPPKKRVPSLPHPPSPAV